MDVSKDDTEKKLINALKLRFLNLDQIKLIDDSLTSVGEYGEIHLIVQHGELRYINKVESVKAWRKETKK